MKKTLIIAEAGVNHNGDIRLAKKLVKAAKESGADIVKFQTVKLDSFITNYAVMADYQKNNTGKVMSQKEMLSKLQLSFEEFREVADYCKEEGITFLSTPNDMESIQFLDNMQDIWKIPSGLVTDYPYLVEISKRKKPVILSTGMCYMNEIRDAVQILKNGGISDLTLLQCTTDYPAPIGEVNLKVMDSLKEEFGCNVGYSDHTEGIEIALAAVARGATVIEKHFTLDKKMEGPDHKASIEPDELKALVDGIRKIEKALGDGKKAPSDTELKNRDIARKSIVAKREIRMGEEFSKDNLITKRPGNGLSPMKWNEIIGTNAKKNYCEDELIEL